MIRWEDVDGAVDVSEYVHGHADRWVVAMWSERKAQWTAPVSCAYQDSTGLSIAFARTLRGVAEAGGVPTYASRSSAARAAARMYGWERVGGGY